MQSRRHVVRRTLFFLRQNHVPPQFGAVLDRTLEVDLRDMLDVFVGCSEDPIDNRPLTRYSEAIAVTATIPAAVPIIPTVLSSVAPRIRQLAIHGRAKEQGELTESSQALEVIGSAVASKSLEVSERLQRNTEEIDVFQVGQVELEES